VLGQFEFGAAQFGVLPLDLLELAGAVVRPLAGLACGRVALTSRGFNGLDFLWVVKSSASGDVAMSGSCKGRPGSGDR
jgi:hypothetical protein